MHYINFHYLCVYNTVVDVITIPNIYTTCMYVCMLTVNTYILLQFWCVAYYCIDKYIVYGNMQQTRPNNPNNCLRIFSNDLSRYC